MSTFLRRGWRIDSIPYSLPNTFTTSDISKSPRLVRKDIYEGGDDVWECSEDLSTLISSIFSTQSINPSLHTLFTRQDLKVLEIGAGHGTPTLTLCRLREALGFNTTVTLQDLNESTFIKYSIPSFQRTLHPELTSITFVTCTWESMLQSPTNESPSEADDNIYWNYDVVLSSETLYRPENFPVISEILLRIFRCNRDTKALFAQKRYYFGLGGGTMPFQLYIKQQGTTQQLNAEIIKTIETGHSNVRDILLIS